MVKKQNYASPVLYCDELGRVKNETCLATEFLKKRKEEGLFIFYFKMAATLFKMSNIHCFSTAQTHNI